MKQCVNVVQEEYDGELHFSIIDYSIEPDACVMTLGAVDGEELIGFKVTVPMMTKRLAFKRFQFILPAGQVKFSSIGEKSDRFIQTLVKYFHPNYVPNYKSVQTYMYLPIFPYLLMFPLSNKNSVNNPDKSQHY